MAGTNGQTSHAKPKASSTFGMELFDEDLDSVAVALNATGAAPNVGKMWARRVSTPLDYGNAATKPAYDQRKRKSPLSDSNRRPPLYKSGALAN